MNDVVHEQLECMQTGIRRIAEQIPAMPLDDVLLMRLMMLAGLGVSDELESRLRPHRLTESEFRTLLTLFGSPGGNAFPSELCRFTSQKPTNMTRITNDLVKHGLVNRRPCEHDRRRVELHITAAGRNLARTLLPDLFEPVQVALTGFSEHEKRQLQTMLRRIIVNLGQLPDACGDTP